MINEGSSDTAQKCTLIQKVAHHVGAMIFLMRFNLASGAGYAKTRQYILEVLSERCQNVSCETFRVNLELVFGV